MCECDVYMYLPKKNMLRRHEELENGTAWSNSSESSDDSSSPQLSAGGLRNSMHHKVMGFCCYEHIVILSSPPLWFSCISMFVKGWFVSLNIGNFKDVTFSCNKTEQKLTP